MLCCEWDTETADLSIDMVCIWHSTTKCEKGMSFHPAACAFTSAVCRLLSVETGLLDGLSTGSFHATPQPVAVMIYESMCM